MKVRKAVIPVAGFGTRFLPATKTIPKVMIPVYDRPSIHYVVEEAVCSGIEEIVIVVSHGQETVMRYFDRNVELEEILEQNREEVLLHQMRSISSMAKIEFVCQTERLGLGHAVLTAKPLIGREPFAVLLPDDLIFGHPPTIDSMQQIFNEYSSSVIAVKRVPNELISSLGIIEFNAIDNTICKINGMIEKPALEKAPSDSAIIGRYILTPEIFDVIDNVKPGALGEIQLTDAIVELLSSQDVYGYRFPGTNFDVGTPSGLLKASLYAAMHTRNTSHDISTWLNSQD